MRKLFLLLMIASAWTLASGQGTTTMNARRLPSTTGAPTGACVSGPPWTSASIRTSNGHIYSCVAGVWSDQSSGVTPSGSPASPQLAKFSSSTAITTATATDVSTPLFCADAGANDTYTCSLSPAPASYVVGTHLRFFANTANTGAASINFNSLGALTIVKVAGGITTTLVNNDIRAGQWVDGVVAAGSNFQIQSTLGNASELSNSAGANVVPKSNGSNLVASRVTDSGDTSVFNIDTPSSITTIGDATALGNGTKIVVDDTSSSVTVSAASTFMWGAAEVLTQSILPISAVNGGTGINTSASTGVATVSGGAWSVDPTLSAAKGGTGINTSASTGFVSITSGAWGVTSNAAVGAPMFCAIGNATLATATGTVYTSPAASGLAGTTEGNAQAVMTRAGTIRNLYVLTGSVAKVNTPATTITIRKNGADTAITLTLTQTTATVTSDTSHTFTVSSGDKITVGVTTTGAAAVSTSIVSIQFQLDPP